MTEQVVVPDKRRQGQGRRPVAPQQADAFHQSPAPRGRGFHHLSDANIAILHERMLDLLENHGVAIAHKQARERLLNEGARLAPDGERLSFPRSLVEHALKTTPKSVTLYGKNPERDIVLPRSDSSFIMRTGTGAHGFVDPETGKYRSTKVADAEIIARVANCLDEIGFIAHPFVHGVPELTADIHSLAQIITHTDKHVWLQPYNKENVEFLLKICAVAAGGEEQLRKRPIASCIICSFTPMEFKVMDIEAIIQCGKLGIPMHACSLPSAGGTGPISVPGLVLMAVTEVAAMVTIASILAPGTPVIGTPLMFTLDMRTGRSLQSCAESIQAAAMAIEFVKHGLGLVAHTYGAGSDTPDVDGQSMAERAMICQAVAQAGADILGGIGQLECATVFSPVQAILDNEMGGMVRRMVEVQPFDDEAFNWPEISTIRTGGHFLDSQHTLKYCRHQYQPRVFMRENRDSYEALGRKTAIENAREICLAMLKRPLPDNLPGEAQVREIMAITKDADRIILAANAGPGARAEI